MNRDEEPLWTEKYRPSRVEDVILPPSLKERFQSFVDSGNIPNLILSGSPGSGKTTVAIAMVKELGCDYYMINGSLNGNKDDLRNDITSFATSVSFNGKRKYVIIDEADGTNPQSFQPSLRNFMEEYSRNCGFIMTCNYKSKIIEPLQSRSTVIDFKIPRAEFPALAKQFLSRLEHILKTENIPYEKRVLQELIKKNHPDWRKTLNELQYYSALGSIDEGILANIKEVSIKELMSMLKNKEFSNMRTWVAENIDSAGDGLYRKLYNNISQYVSKETVPLVILIIGKYLYQHAFSADAEINLVCCLTEIMTEAEFV